MLGDLFLKHAYKFKVYLAGDTYILPQKLGFLVLHNHAKRTPLLYYNYMDSDISKSDAAKITSITSDVLSLLGETEALGKELLGLERCCNETFELRD